MDGALFYMPSNIVGVHSEMVDFVSRQRLTALHSLPYAINGIDERPTSNENLCRTLNGYFPFSSAVWVLVTDIELVRFAHPPQAKKMQ
jgi:hypothetical protein